MLKYKLLLGILLVTFFTNNIAIAQTHKGNEQGVKRDYKCWVEFYGGQDTIHFVKVAEQSSKDIANMLIGQKVLAPFSNKKKKIFRVFECVGLYDDFSSDRGRKIDKETLR